VNRKERKEHKEREKTITGLDPLGSLRSLRSLRLKDPAGFFFALFAPLREFQEPRRCAKCCRSKFFFAPGPLGGEISETL